MNHKSNHLLYLIILIIIGLSSCKNKPVKMEMKDLKGFWTSEFKNENDQNLRMDLYFEYYEEDDEWYNQVSVTKGNFGSAEMMEFKIEGEKFSFPSSLGLVEGEFVSNDLLKAKINGFNNDMEISFERIQMDGSLSGYDDGDPYGAGYGMPGSGGSYWVWLIIAGLFWLGFIIIMILVLRKQNKLESPGLLAKMKDNPKHEVSDLIPLVRIQRRKGLFRRDKGLLVNDIFLGLFKKSRNHNIEYLFEEGSNETFVTSSRLKNQVKLFYPDIESVQISRPSRNNRVQLRVKGNSGGGIKKRKYELAFHELPNLITALDHKLKDKLILDTPIRFHKIGHLIIIIIVSLLFTFLISLADFAISGEINPKYFIWIKLTGLVLIHALILVIPTMVWTFRHLTKRDPKEVRKKFKDLSDRRPFRSRPISYVLKIGALILGYFAIFKWDLGTFLTYFIIGNVLFVAHALAQRDPNKDTRNKNVSPILYLRSFLDDRETTLSPNNRFSSFIGIDPPVYFLEEYDLHPRSPLYKILKRGIKYFYNYHPFRLWKLLIGKPSDTSEQQIGKFMARYGKFIAIGKPGERIATTGAARMYVGNDNWQDVVLNLMDSARIIIIQPSRTEGIWWEIEKVINRIPPQKLLMCMVNYKGYQNDYEDFRIRMKSLINDLEIRPDLGLLKPISFMHFDKDWNPQLEFVKYRYKIAWPFFGSALNLKKTLAPFIEKIPK